VCCTLSIINLQLTSPDCRTAHKRWAKVATGKARTERGNPTPWEGHTWSNWPLELPFARSFFMAHCIPIYSTYVYGQRLFLYLFGSVLYIFQIIPASSNTQKQIYWLYYQLDIGLYYSIWFQANIVKRSILF